MTYTIENCSDTNRCNNIRKGLSAIASRKTGSILSLSEEPSSIVTNIAAPKEISAPKCHAQSILAL